MKQHHSSKNRRPCTDGYHCRARIWVENSGETYLGFGRVVLLERILEHGSIAGAARSMNMSYKHAWDLIDSMNRQADQLLVITSKGGKRGGGTRLTETGEAAVRFFRRLHDRLDTFLAQETEQLRQLIQPPQHSRQCLQSPEQNNQQQETTHHGNQNSSG